MSCRFSIEFTGTPGSIVARAKEAITGAGGNFSGDAVGGQFGLSTVVGSVRGDGIMQFSPKAMELAVTDGDNLILYVPK